MYLIKIKRRPMVAPTTSKEIPCLNKFSLAKFIINTSFLSPFPHQIYDLVGSPIKNFVFEISHLKLFLSSCGFALCKLSLKFFTLTLVFKLLSLFFSLGSCLCLIILSGNFIKMLEVFLLLKKLT